MGEVIHGRIYGDFIFLQPSDNIEEVKAKMLSHIKEVIDEVAKDERFWIIKESNAEGYPTLGWKISFPQIKDYAE